jgi:quaternary ammonium compound-resistance protein SugE
MAWLLLIASGLCEAAWAIALKYSEGFSRLLPSIATVAAMGASLGLFGLAVKTLPIGTAYVIWTGIGAAATTALGMYLFNEPPTILRLACIGLILAGIAGLRLSS